MGVGNALPTAPMKAQASSSNHELRPKLRLEFRACACNLRRLFLDEAAVTSLEYVLAVLAVALGAIAASRVVAGALVGYLHRIYVVVTLPIP